MKSFRSPCGVFFDQSPTKPLNGLIVSQQGPLSKPTTATEPRFAELVLMPEAV